jgi:hypothetical protein
MRTSDGTHQDGCADTDALTSSLESLDLNAGGCLNHDIEPWFAGKHSVEANDASTMAQETMTNERGAIRWNSELFQWDERAGLCSGRDTLVSHGVYEPTGLQLVYARGRGTRDVVSE